MAFPSTPLGAITEIYLGSTLGWVDITSDVRLSSAHSGGGISITRGAPNEGTSADPGRANLVLNNRHGKYSARNPLSSYFGLLGRNTPVRTRIPALANAAYLKTAPHGSLAPLTTPDVAALEITGDLDVRVDVQFDRIGAYPDQVALAGRWSNSDPQRVWAFVLIDGQYPQIHLSSDGTFATWRIIKSANPWTPTTARNAIRVTVDVDNGASGTTVTFYTAPSLAGPWTQLSASTVAAIGSINGSSSQPLQLGALIGMGAPVPVQGRIYGVQVRNGIGGTVVADLDVDGVAGTATGKPGDSTVTDRAGRVWTVNAGRVVDDRIRLYMEVPSWPPRWDVSGRDVWTPIEAAGILRRLSQGASPVLSPLRRYTLSQSPVTYLPLEDGTAATAPTVLGTRGGVGGQLNAQFGDGETLISSAATAKLDVTQKIWSTVNMVDTVTEWSVYVLLRMPSLPAVYTRFLSINCLRGVLRFDVYVQTGSWRVGAFTDTSPIEAWATTVAFSPGGGPDVGWTLVRLNCKQNGANIDVDLKMRNELDTAFYGLADSMPSATLSAVTRVQVEPANIDGTSLAHLAVFDSARTTFDSTFAPAFYAYAGEWAADRMKRLSTENGVAFWLDGQTGDTEPMGPQRQGTYLDLMREAAGVDGGVLCEARDQLALVYRTRVDLYNQPTVTLDYAAKQVAPPFDPTDDDDQVRNSITVNRPDGASVQAAQSTGPLSTQAPPAGVGLYEDSIEANVYTDGQLTHQAGWRLHLGTVDEARYPRIRTNLAVPAVAADAAFVTRVAGVDSGDALAVTNLPAWLPPGPARALVQGYAETLDAYAWDITWTAGTASGYDVAYVAQDRATPLATEPRVCADSSTLWAGITSSATALRIASPTSEPWTTDPCDMPVLVTITGEVIELRCAGAPLNLNPWFDVDASNWSGVGATVARTTTSPYYGAGALAVTPDGVSANAQGRSEQIPVTVGVSYRAAVLVWCTTAASAVTLSIAWYTSGGVLVSSTTGPTTPASPDWQTLTVTGTAPATTAGARIVVSLGGTPPATNVMRVDSATLVAAADLVSPVLYTVATRAVNGIAKSHAAGEAVDVTYPAIIPL